jgi:hypothetical protein
LKKVFIFCVSDPNKEPRVIRTIEALSANYEITFCGYSAYKGLKFIDLGEFVERKKSITFHLKFPAFIRKPISALLNIFYYSKSENILNPLFNINKAVDKLKKYEPDVMICHGLGFLQLCGTLKAGKTKLIFNAHEYYLKEFEENAEWVKHTKPHYKYLLDKYTDKIDLMFCVCESIQADYQKEYKLNSVVINNARDYSELKPKELQDGETVKLIHHGAALRGRKIELIIEVGNLLPENYELTLMLTNADPQYLSELKQNAKNKRIHFAEPVEMDKIPSFLNNFDIGLYILPPTNYNNLAALPNKFFDFIQGRLCLAVSPNIEMKNIIEKYNIGIVSSDFTPEKMADKIKALTVGEINNFKNNSDKRAGELSGEKNKEKVLSEVKKLVLN